jgi:hypothetical protein
MKMLRRFPAMIVFAALSMTIFVLSLLFHPDFEGPLEVGTGPGDRGLSIVVEMGKLIVELATLVYVGLGFLVFYKNGQLRSASLPERLLIVACLLMAGMAVYGVFSMYFYAAEQAEHVAFSFSSAPIRVSLSVAYYSLLGAVFTLGLWFVLKMDQARSGV